MAAGAHGAAVIAVAMDGEIGGEKVELLAIAGTHEKGIARGPLPHRVLQHGLALVQGAPFEAVPAEREVNLFLLRLPFAAISDKEIAGGIVGEGGGRKGQQRGAEDEQA